MHRFLSRLRGRVFLLVVLAVIPALGMLVLNGLDQRRMAAARAQDEAT